MLYTKEWDKTSVELSEIETGNFPKKVFLVIIVRIIKKLGKKIYVQSEKLEFFNRVRKYKEQQNRNEEYNNWNEKH